MKKRLTLISVVLFCLTAVYGFQRWHEGHFFNPEKNTLTENSTGLTPVINTAAETCTMVTPPFTEDFNNSSLTRDCWTIVDVDNDRSGPLNMNTWSVGTSPLSSPHEGDGNAFFIAMDNNIQDNVHNDWLISPAVNLNGGIYEISYYYMNKLYPLAGIGFSDYEVLLSQNGTTLSEFTTVLEPMHKSQQTAYQKKTLYIQGITGEVHIAWHTVNSLFGLAVDLVTIEEVDCMPPRDIKMQNLKEDSVTFSWEDDINSSWEYHVSDGMVTTPPVGGGNLISNKNVAVTRVTGGANLQPGGFYTFYVRSMCGTNQFSPWQGPFYFTTPCNSQSLPFWEGFNVSVPSLSPTMDCWLVFDEDDNGTIAGREFWNKSSYSPYEGDGSMMFSGSILETKPPSDDWLVSPTFTLDATKIYRLRYHYRTDAGGTDFDVLLSSQGSAPLDFDQTLLTKNKESSISWQEERLIIQGTGGDISFGWYVYSSEFSKKGVEYTTSLSIDNVFVEEVTDCPEPFKLGTRDEKADEVTLIWTDEIGTSWEYIVQKEGKSPPGVTGVSGTAATANDVTVTQDKEGNPLEPNTEYEFYVRTNCGNGEYSIWMGPYVFRTACKVYTTPFWEGFNLDSESKDCWTIVNEDRDRFMFLIEPQPYEGTHAAVHQGSTTGANDWLISPALTFESGKTYRLRYHYQTLFYDGLQSNGVEFRHEYAVLLSNSGTDTDQFTHVVIPHKDWGTTPPDWKAWKDEYVFISGVSGEVHLAWHVESQYKTVLTVDNIFVEEVEGCPEPLPDSLGVKDESSNSATIFWADDMGGTQWEYYVQEEGKGVPTGNGTQTTQTENTVTQEQAGEALEPNTDYEFYVRTVCGNGEYSIWTGPFSFVTDCSLYTTPFKEDFKIDSKTYRCWTVTDNNGNQERLSQISKPWELVNSTISMGDEYVITSSNNPSDNWLISPEIASDGGLYMLKYHYNTQNIRMTGINDFEVLLSSNGIATNEFTTVLAPVKNTYTGVFKEEVIYFNAPKGDIHIAWHALPEKYGDIRITNVSLTKVDECPEPYAIEVTDQTTTTIDIEWQQYGPVTDWEVIVVEYGQDETATPVFTTTVTGTPKTTITGLHDGQFYTIYVRTICDSEKSHWSTPIHTALKVKNDECSGALTIPVNDGTECEQTLNTTLMGATASNLILPDCNWGTYTNSLKNMDPSERRDVWFEFTASSDSHILRILEGYATTNYLSVLLVTVYESDCGTIDDTALQCFQETNLSLNEHSGILIDNLTAGNKYYIRMFMLYEEQVNTFLKLCLTTPHYVSVSAAGEEYSLEELVSDVLIDSECKVTYDIRLKNGDGSAYNQSVNTLGYFNKNGSIFPFEEGIVLSTADVQHVPGPSQGSGSTRNRGPYQTYWSGDKDVNDVLEAVGGSWLGLESAKQSTQLEFEFIPVKDSIQFEYLFASNVYRATGEAHNTRALFGVWLTDLTTEEGGNVALVPNTTYPIANNTIRRGYDYPTGGESFAASVNAEYTWKLYGTPDNPLLAPVDFVGLTVPMQSVKTEVVPGRKYRIKFVIVNLDGEYNSSTVFFNKASFDLGAVAINTEELGTEDLLIETNTALCAGESAVLRSGVVASDELSMEIEWHKDGVLIPGANDPDLEVDETGEYEIKVKFPDLECESSDSIIVEVYPPISETVNQAEAIVVCQYALQEMVVDLTSVEQAMFAAVDRSIYTTGYYKTAADAEVSENEILNVDSYVLGKEVQEQTLYIRVENTVTGCHEVFELYLQPEKGAVPDQLENVRVCAEYVFPATANNQYYYTEPGGAGEAYKAGDVLAEPGEHTIYLLQVNTDKGCYEETVYQVNITAPVTADIFEDQTLSCEYYELAPLSEHNSYYTEPEGQGTELYEGMQILHKQTVYIYASSDDGLCIDESSFVIDYEDCPIPRGISPNGDNLNDVFDLTPHGVESIKIYNRWGTEVYAHGEGYTTQWHGQSKSGKQLPDGTYYYVIQAHGKIRTGWVQINK